MRLLNLYSEKKPNTTNLNKRKEIASLLKTAHNNAKKQNCILCGKKVTSFCNSHSIPLFSLKNISNNGEVCNYNSLIKISHSKEKNGLKNAGTFQTICRECDNTVFQDYENPDTYNNTPCQKVLAQIALKCSLKSISKRYQEIEIQKLYINNFFDGSKLLDLIDYENDLIKAKKTCTKNIDGYYLIYYKLLDYVTPIAFQSGIALYKDFDGKIINDIYYKNPSYHIKQLYVCIFPLKTKTAILLFIDNTSNRYRNFYRKFKKLSEEDKLSTINYLIFLYSEDFYYSPTIKQIIDNDNELKKIAGLTTTRVTTFKNYNQNEDDPFTTFNLANHKSITNILLEKYRLQH